MPKLVRHSLIAFGSALWFAGLWSQFHSLTTIATYVVLSLLMVLRGRALTADHSGITSDFWPSISASTGFQACCWLRMKLTSSAGDIGSR